VSLFLDDAELVTLTGRRMKSRQIEWLQGRWHTIPGERHRPPGGDPGSRRGPPGAAPARAEAAGLATASHRRETLMGRKPSRWDNLPKGMRARPRGNLVHYYLDTGAKPRKEIPLGSDYVQAVAKWAELTSRPAPPAPTPRHVPRRGERPRQVRRLPQGRAAHEGAAHPAGQREGARVAAEVLRRPAGAAGQHRAAHIKQYLRWRVKAAKAAAEAKNEQRRKDGRPELPIEPNLGHVRANREKALFSHIWNYAREEGLTKLPNPCAGVGKFGEEGRDTAPDAELVARVLARGRPAAAVRDAPGRHHRAAAGRRAAHQRDAHPRRDPGRRADRCSRARPARSCAS
jgi:hypothetical protein